MSDTLRDALARLTVPDLKDLVSQRYNVAVVQQAL